MPRPKEFDRDQALDRAMELFWARGFEATSIGDLTQTLGIGRQSLYDTFGDKHALYLAALDRYIERYGGLGPGAVEVKGPVRKVMRRLYQAVIDTTIEDPGRACMLVSAAAERCPSDGAVRDRFCRNATLLEAAMARRLEQARAELPNGADPRALARTLVTVLLGLQVSAKGGTPRQTLEQVADTAVALLG
jgi:TetR/AcrR family transcriptional regulator, transcriptional repressor for nem operon